MQDLTAQVTSDLLHFPEVTIEALGEDEITLESVLRGKFAAGKYHCWTFTNLGLEFSDKTFAACPYSQS